MIRGKCAQLQGENKSLQNTERGTAHNEICFSRDFDMCAHLLVHVSVLIPCMTTPYLNAHGEW